jgi:hypothetical protein
VVKSLSMVGSMPDGELSDDKRRELNEYLFRRPGTIVS